MKQQLQQRTDVLSYFLWEAPAELRGAQDDVAAHRDPAHRGWGGGHGGEASWGGRAGGVQEYGVSIIIVIYYWIICLFYWYRVLFNTIIVCNNEV